MGSSSDTQTNDERVHCNTSKNVEDNMTCKGSVMVVDMGVLRFQACPQRLSLALGKRLREELIGDSVIKTSSACRTFKKTRPPSGTMNSAPLLPAVGLIFMLPLHMLLRYRSESTPSSCRMCLNARLDMMAAAAMETLVGMQ